MSTAAFELYGDLQQRGPLVITCEHASNRVPRPLRATDEDAPWLQTHWGIDIGAANVAREIVRRTGSIGVLAGFSRLVCDPNREPDSPTWLWTDIEGYCPSFNRSVDDAERLRRRTTLYEPYHAAIDRSLGERLTLGGDVILLAMHSFTPVYAGKRRTMEIGILFSRYAAVAKRLQRGLRSRDLDAVLNEPYSGREGMMFAAERHGRAHDVVHLELEVRQDLIGTPARAQQVGRQIADALADLKVRAKSRR